MPRPQTRKVTTATWVQLSDRPPNVKLVGSSTELSGRLRGIRDGELIVVEFLAPWCRSCRAVHPKVVRLAKSHADVVFLQVDASALSALTWAKGVQQLPTFHLHVGGQPGAQRSKGSNAPGSGAARDVETAVAVLTASPNTFSRLEEAVDRLLQAIRGKDAAEDPKAIAPESAHSATAPPPDTPTREALHAPLLTPPTPPPRPKPLAPSANGLSAAIGVPIGTRAPRTPVSPRSPHSASIRKFGQIPDGGATPPAASAARAAAAAARAAAAASVAAVRAIQAASERHGGVPGESAAGASSFSPSPEQPHEPAVPSLPEKPDDIPLDGSPDPHKEMPDDLGA